MPLSLPALAILAAVSRVRARAEETKSLEGALFERMDPDPALLAVNLVPDNLAVTIGGVDLDGSLPILFFLAVFDLSL
jgi:hypothetical protein